MDFSGCADDLSFGPAVRGCRGDFDFTIKFEKIFFALIPAPVFIALALSRAVYLARKPVIINGTFLRAAKLTTISIFTVLQLALLVLSGTKSHKFRTFFIPSDAVTFASGSCMLLLSHLEHSRSLRPSVLFNAYLFVTILLDIAQVRTLFLASTHSDEVTYTRLFTSGVAFKALIIILESQSKSRWIASWDVKEHSPEETTGLYGLGAYFWLNQLFLKGYGKVLEISDLYPLDHNMASEKLYSKMAHYIDPVRLRGKKHALTLATTKALAVPLLLPVAVPLLLPVGPRIALTAFQFCQPFLIQTLLEYLQQPAETSPKNVGYGLIGATILIYVGIAIATAFYWYFQERAVYMARGLLASAIYRKTTESKLGASGESAALTLMSADIERIIQGCLTIHEFWANTVEVALASWLLSRQLGAAFVAPMAMKYLKISGLAEAVEGAIQSMRMDELKAGARFRTVIVYAVVVGFTPVFLSPLITFAFASRTLDVTTVFTSVSYIMLLASPLTNLFQSIPNLLASFTCFNRIQQFLEQDSRADFRHRPSPHNPRADSKGEKSVQEFSDSPVDARAPKVRITGGSFGWDTERMTLEDINLDIPASQLTIVVGPIASGKSTLCRALLGEVPVSKGQTPYLSNGTIRDNIVGFAPFLQERYDEVIEATMLRPDLALFPQGDSTNIGSNGITLSGGQKQRVSMARALYLDTDFYVFDDILSGLDADTEQHVFLRVFSPAGLLPQRNATAVLCTHSVRHLPSADHVVALGPDGTIVEQGTFQELMANEQYVHSLGVEMSDSHSGGSSTPAETSIPEKESARAPVHPPTSSKEEELARRMGDWAVYRHYFTRIDTLSKVSFIVIGIIWGGLSNTGTIWLKFWSEDVASPHRTHSDAFYNGIYAIFQIVPLISVFFIAYICFTIMITVSGARLHKEALSTVINAPLKFFTTTDTGIVVNLFSQDMALVDNQLPQAIINFVLTTFEAVGLAGVIATSSPYIAIAYPFLVAIMYVIQNFYLRTSRQIRLLDLEAKSPLYSHFIDTINGIATFRAFGWVQEGIEQNYRLLNTSQRPAYLLAMIQRWLALTLQLIVAVIALGVVTMATQMRSNMAFTGASLIALMSFGENLAWIIRCYTLLETSIGAISRLKAFSENVKPESKEGEDVVPPKKWPLRGEIVLKEVSATYGDLNEDGTSMPDRLALDNLDLTIAPGEKVAICGRSGSSSVDQETDEQMQG
ncbi:hypothetical protein N0V88_007462 [Collariella sp. IMI 366227]|nr:hypothetical protein N0V88_007462 [Collariella sp. IMI 366227]